MKNQSTGVAQLGNWYAVAAVAAASFGLVGGVQEANATPGQIIVHPVGGPVTAPMATSTTFGGIIFNVLDSTGKDFITVPPAVGSPGSLNVALAWPPLHPGGAALVATRPGATSVLVGGSTPSHGAYAAKLGAGAAINSSVFGSGSKAREQALLGVSSSGTRVGNWQPGDTGFIGLAVFPFGASAPIFGWAEIHLASNYDPTLIAWGFNATPGVTDFTPSLPEPSSLLLLASGAAGLAAYRRRRAQRRSAGTHAQAST